MINNRALAILTLLSLAACAIPASAEPQECDPANVLGSETCVKCHQQEVAQWQLTPHYQTFDELHRKPEAKAIADRLGLRSVKRNDTCVNCHYTQQESTSSSGKSRIRLIEGISCESCHGAARNWLELHADYGGLGITRETESASHRERRREQSIAAGMNNPANLYLLARQCLGCHTTPDERLVNVGGHTPGSADFELVAWSQGMVRHNFARTGGAENAPSGLARVRLMFIVGSMADLEASLRAVAKATTADTFGKTAAARAARVKQRLWDIQRAIDEPLLAKALDAVSELQLTLDNSAAITAAADSVGAAARRFAAEVDGRELREIDPLIPRPNTYKY